MNMNFRDWLISQLNLVDKVINKIRDHLSTVSDDELEKFAQNFENDLDIVFLKYIQLVSLLRKQELLELIYSRKIRIHI